MQSAALAKAAARLARAEKAVKDLAAATSHDQAEEAWNDFLSASGVVFNVLEQGSKSNSRSAGWYSRVKGERRSDPALSYLHQARNSDTHGIESVTSRHQRYDFPPGLPIIAISIEGDGPLADTTFKGPDGIKRKMRLKKSDSIQLIPVRNRGIIYDPPTLHMNQLLDDPLNPLPLARLAIAHLHRLIAEAGKLAE